MDLLPHQVLSIIVIICFFPALLAAGCLCLLRGVGQHWGWLYLFILTLARVVGGALQIASESTGSKSALSDAAAILSSSGLMALILVMLEIIQRVKQKWLERDPVPPIVWRMLYWSQWAAFILSIIAMSLSNDSLWKAAILLMAVMFAIQTFASIVFASRLKHLLKDLNQVLLILLATIPFLTVRILYAILDAFTNTGSVFGGSSPNVAALALMQYSMELIVATMYLVVGFSITPCRDSKSEEDEEAIQINERNYGP